MTRKAPPPRVPAHARTPARARTVMSGNFDAAPASNTEPHVVGQHLGNEADPEQDVAPNLGGESQMQDA